MSKPASALDAVRSLGECEWRASAIRQSETQWGGWRAVAGSAAFFAIYHPALSWLPVAMLGMANALLLKKTGRLAPAVVLHMVYNAVVLS